MLSQTVSHMDISLSPWSNLRKETNEISNSPWVPNFKIKSSLNQKRPIHRIRKLNKREIELRKKVLSTILSEGDLISDKNAFSPNVYKNRDKDSKFLDEFNNK